MSGKEVSEMHPESISKIGGRLSLEQKHPIVVLVLYNYSYYIQNYTNVTYVDYNECPINCTDTPYKSNNEIKKCLQKKGEEHRLRRHRL